jgi:hypothetical protein
MTSVGSPPRVRGAPLPPKPSPSRATRRARRAPASRANDAPTAPAVPTTTGIPTALTGVSGTMQNCCTRTAPPRPAVARPANPCKGARAAPSLRALVSDSTRRTPPPAPTTVAPAPATVVKGFRSSTHTYATPLQPRPVVCTSTVTSNRPTVTSEIDSRSTVPDQPRPSSAIVTVPTCTSPPAMCTVYVRSVTRDCAVPSTGTREPDRSGRHRVRRARTSRRRRRSRPCTGR